MFGLVATGAALTSNFVERKANLCLLERFHGSLDGVLGKVKGPDGGVACRSDKTLYRQSANAPLLPIAQIRVIT